ncbi:MAG: ATP phosphoribosyltransferase regulatory subunit, partial [Eubacterium sp.]
IMEYLEQNAMLTEDSPQKAVLLYHQEDKSFAYETAAAFRRSDYPAELFTLRTTPEECIAALNESTLYQKVRYYFVNGNSLMLFSEGTFIETDLISELGGR